MKKIFLFISCIALLLPLPASALPLVDIEAAIGGWQQSPSGWLSYEAEDELDLDDLLDYDDETRLTGRLKINLPSVIPNIYLMAAPMEFDESAVSPQDYEFGSIQVMQGMKFDSELVLDQYDIGLFYNVPLLETATLKRLNIEVGLNARIYDAEATVVNKTYNIRESESETVVVPMGYLGVSLRPIDRIALEGEVRGMTYSDTDVYSLIGRVRVNTFGPTFVTGGYRYEKLDSQDWDLEFDMDFSGPFFEAGLSF